MRCDNSILNTKMGWENVKNSTLFPPQSWSSPDPAMYAISALETLPIPMNDVIKIIIFIAIASSRVQIAFRVLLIAILCLTVDNSENLDFNLIDIFKLFSFCEWLSVAMWKWSWLCESKRQGEREWEWEKDWIYFMWQFRGVCLNSLIIKIRFKHRLLLPNRI